MANPIPVGYLHYKPDIEAAAAQAGLDPIVVAAVCWQESAFNTDAYRFEPAFYNRYIKPKGLYPGMNPRRISASYGLMQPMAVSAYELGYKGQPEGLFDPTVGLHWGCAKLRKAVDWAAQFPGTDAQRLASALAGYNGGLTVDNRPTATPLRNGVYASGVLAKIAVLTPNKV